jgi:hypothetical protein
MSRCSLALIAAAEASGESGRAVATGGMVVLFFTVLALLGVFLMVVALLAISVRRRLARGEHSRAPGDDTPPSAWEEAGRRVEGAKPPQGAGDAS